MSKVSWKRGLCAALLAVLLPMSISAQETQSTVREELEALKKGQETIVRQIEIMQEIEELKKGQEEIRKQLQEIMKMLQAQPTARAAAGPNVKDVVLTLGENPVKGESTAPVTLVEFTDYQ